MLRIAELVERAVVGRTARRRDLVGQMVKAVLQVTQLGHPTENRVEHAAVLRLGELLRQVPDLQVLPPVHLTRIGRLHAQDDLEERRLAGAIAADQRDPPARHEAKGHVAEELLGAVRLGQPRDGDHRSTLARTPPRGSYLSHVFELVKADGKELTCRMPANPHCDAMTTASTAGSSTSRSC
jgi:hypothetical protein